MRPNLSGWKGRVAEGVGAERLEQLHCQPSGEHAAVPVIRRTRSPQVGPQQVLLGSPLLVLLPVHGARLQLCPPRDCGAGGGWPFQCQH